MKKSMRVLLGVGTTSLCLAAAACGSTTSSPTTTTTGSTGSSSAASNHAPLKIALITSETGLASPQFQSAPQGFLAAVAAQNAKGGINGHKIETEVLDDQSSPTLVATAAQQAISSGVVGIVADSSLFFEAAKFPQQAGIPVTGGSFDGPEWGTQPYTNMFAADTGSVNPTFPVNTANGQFLKSHGGTTLGSYGYGISPQSAYATYGAAKSSQLAGLKVGVQNASVAYGSTSFQTEALQAKSGGIDSLIANMDNNSNFALLSAIQQEGVKLKAVYFPAGYDQSLVGSNVWSSLQGSYFGTPFRPFQIPHNAGVDAMQSALMKYQGWKSTQFPTFGQYEAYLGATLMMKGLSLAGANPTSATVVSALRNKVTDWTANGLLGITINYQNIFGHFTPQSCVWIIKAEQAGFVPMGTTTTCGTYIKGSTTMTAAP